MTLEIEKEKVHVKFSMRPDRSYSPISRFEHIPKEDQEDLIAGDAGFYAIEIEASFNSEIHHFISQGMILSHDDDEREEEFESIVMSDGGLLEEVITRVKTWASESGEHPRWSK